MARNVVLCAAVLIAAAGKASAEADSLNDPIGPRQIALGEALRAAAIGSAAAHANPAGVALTRAYVIEGSFGIRPGDDARLAAGSVCDSVTSARIAACLSYDYFSSSPEGGSRTAHEIALTTSVPLGDRVFLGVSHKYRDYEESGTEAMPEDHSTSGYGADGGAILKLTDSLNVAVVGYNLVGNDEDQFPMGIGTGLAFFLSTTLMIAADARWNLETDDGRWGAGLEYFLTTSGGQQGFPLRGGYVYDEVNGASYVTGGLGYITPRVAVDVGGRKQVSKEGDETLVQVGLRVFLPN
jgi:hypothetical protein